MPSRITRVAVPTYSPDSTWKIVNNVTELSLLDAAMGLIVDGGDQEYIKKRVKDDLGAKFGGPDLLARRELAPGTVAVDLRVDKEVVSQRSGVLLAPIARYQKLVVVDRDEIESYRALERLLHDYKESDAKRPLSIAVFGPPGSGKSFGIKQVIKAVLESEDEDFLEFNLAQFSQPSELADACLQISSLSAGRRLPIAFFDEFDTSLQNDEYGWLRYFLAPMQDGEIFVNRSRHKIGKSIFCFAGGVKDSFEEFQKAVFGLRKMKGKDFVSRLAGHINILGVNRVQPSDRAYVLRRALIIRHELIERKLVGRTNRTLVDKNFLRKLLEVREYSHGARSIGKLIDMCIGPRGIMHIPPADQLAMHISRDDVRELLQVGVQ